MASNNDNAKKKFDWSDNFVMILCDILKKYIMKNGRNSPIKWLELQPAFERVANTKLHSYKALKNKYDGMRKDYNLWKSLRNGETGLGWNETTRQLNCSDEWWDKKVKENPNVKAIRKKQPSSELQEAWDQIFGDAVASGTDCVAPSMDPSTFSDMPHVIIDDENPTTGDENEDGTFFSSQFPQDSPHLENLENADGTYFSNLMNFASDVLSPNKTGGSNQPKKSSKETSKIKPIQMKRRKRESAGVAMFKEFITQQKTTQQRTLELLESDASTVNQCNDYSIGAAVCLINKMVDDGIITKGSELWCFAMSLFEDAVKRELFLSLPDDAGRLAWLNYKNSVGK